MRIATLMLLLAGAAAAQAGDYDRLIDEANRLQRERRPGEGPDMPHQRAYQRLFEAAEADPARWEAFALRGINRCEVAVIMRHRLATFLNDMTARGRPAGEILDKQQGGLAIIGRTIGLAQHAFDRMKERLKAQGRPDPKRILYSEAALKFASADYVGAKEDFKRLVRAGWRQEICSEFVARCYLQYGAVLYVRKEHDRAHEAWMEGVKWAQTPETKRHLKIQIAASNESAGQHGAAKDVLERLIDQEPNRPALWRNLGLLLGKQGAKREALHAYGKVREICNNAETPFFLGLLYGSVWLKSAMIHGKLLTEDGDLLVAWNLFLEYREMFGDDYNFCLNFGDFAFHMGQYKLAAVYLERARKLHPFCLLPHLLMQQLLHRLPGDPEKMKKRFKELEEAIKRGKAQDPGPNLRQLCAGLIDRADSAHVARDKELIQPDPLARYVAGKPPSWLVKAAERRDPFKPFVAPNGAVGTAAEGPADGSRNGGGSQEGLPAPWIVGFGVLAMALGAVFWLRRR